MNNIKVLIIEDELLTATDLKENLIDAGYIVSGIANTNTKAIQLAKHKDPDIILLDIEIKGDKNGIETAKELKEFWSGPFVFVTAHNEENFIESAKSVNPHAYLLKPYKINDVMANINMAIHNFYYQEVEPFIKPIKNSLFLPINGNYEKVNKSDILFIEANGSYAEIQSIDNKRFLLSINLKSFEKQLQDDNFFRISRKYIVNLNFLNKIVNNTAYIQNTEFPITISDLYRKSLFRKLQVIKTN